MKKIFFIITLICIAHPITLKEKPYNANNLSGWAIPEHLMQYILKTLPINSTILELGSGAGTQELAKFYKMYSIEHNKNWIDKYDSHYIYTPIQDYDTYRWYDIETVNDNLPNNYDLILVDGPLGAIGREGFFYNLSLFNTNTTLIFDDTNRPAELRLIQNIAKALGRSYKIYNKQKGESSFGVILPNRNTS